MRHRFATRDDVAQWFEGQVPATMRALVIEDGGEVIAIAGLATSADCVQAFSDIKPAARKHPVALGRMTIAIKNMMEAMKCPIVALCNPDEPTAPGLLAHLGFEQHSATMWRRG